ncbi:expressed unknown protein [Seminavis robusta]|uniref:Transmembrane protein n=1 Tax=Seminavis robusta TaxID=568900 RepID=A0A9N8EXC7_9STRA|nr:expressed unknown protein [Seminavis robusta]|eukprot:Sro2368_g325130.1 n/a (306) ;mRNA; f:10705-11622
MLSPSWKRALIALYSLLLTVVVVVYVVDLILYEETWACTACRGGQEASPIPLLVYFSVWTFWLTIAVFLSWIFLEKNTVNQEGESSDTINADEEQGEDNEAAPTMSKRKTTAQYLFSLALPLALTVSLTYTYYVATNPASEFFDNDLCYTAWRSSISRELEKWMADLYLVGAVIADWIVHYLCSVLILVLYFSGELRYVVALPLSTSFSICLGIIIALVQQSGKTAYCGGGIWFNVGIICMFTLIFHVTFYLGANTRKVGCSCCINNDAQPKENCNRPDCKDAKRGLDMPGSDLSIPGGDLSIPG